MCACAVCACVLVPKLCEHISICYVNKTGMQVTQSVDSSQLARVTCQVQMVQKVVEARAFASTLNHQRFLS